MAFVPIPSAMKAEVIWNLGAQEVVITLTVRKSAGGTITQADVDGVADTIHSWAQGAFRGVLSAAAFYTLSRVTDISTATGPQAVRIPATTVVGQYAGTSAPNNVSLVTTLRTGLRGRSYRGRSYLFALPTGQLGGSSTTVVNTYALSVLAAYIGLQAALLIVGKTLAVPSKVLDGVARNPGVATPVTTFSNDVLLDSQRRRLAGRGT